MSNYTEYIQELNKEYGLELTGISPRMGSRYIPASATRIVVKDFGNGMGRVVYVDPQKRLISNTVEPLAIAPGNPSRRSTYRTF